MKGATGIECVSFRGRPIRHVRGDRESVGRWSGLQDVVPECILVMSDDDGSCVGQNFGLELKEVVSR